VNWSEYDPVNDPADIVAVAVPNVPPVPGVNVHPGLQLSVIPEMTGATVTVIGKLAEVPCANITAAAHGCATAEKTSASRTIRGFFISAPTDYQWVLSTRSA
jgi:hypothetical protein